MQYFISNQPLPYLKLLKVMGSFWTAIHFSGDIVYGKPSK